MKGKDELKKFVEGLEMTILTEEDSILLDGMVGTSGGNVACNSDDNCSKTGCTDGTDNCRGGNCGNCVSGCGK